MKDDRISFGAKKQMKKLGGWRNGYLKPKGKYWKRYYNKRVRTGKAVHKRDNAFWWC